jgi:hypothetical protein
MATFRHRRLPRSRPTCEGIATLRRVPDAMELEIQIFRTTFTSAVRCCMKSRVPQFMKADRG